MLQDILITLQDIDLQSIQEFFRKHKKLLILGATAIGLTLLSTLVGPTSFIIISICCGVVAYAHNQDLIENWVLSHPFTIIAAAIGSFSGASLGVFAPFGMIAFLLAGYIIDDKVNRITAAANNIATSANTVVSVVTTPVSMARDLSHTAVEMVCDMRDSVQRRGNDIFEALGQFFEMMGPGYGEDEPTQSEASPANAQLVVRSQAMQLVANSQRTRSAVRQGAEQPSVQSEDVEQPGIVGRVSRVLGWLFPFGPLFPGPDFDIDFDSDSDDEYYSAEEEGPASSSARPNM